MLIAVSLISPEGRTKLASNPRRVEWATRTMRSLRAESPHDDMLLALPAGFLTVRKEEAIDECANEVIAVANEMDMTVVLGVDVRDEDEWKSTGSKTDLAVLGSFVCRSNRWHRRGPARQRSVTSADGLLLADAVASEERSVFVGEHVVEVIMCGEVFAAGVRRGISARGRCVAVVLGHTAHGSRHGHGIKRLTHDASSGITVFRAVHAATDARTYWGRPSHLADRRKPDDDVWVDVFRV